MTAGAPVVDFASVEVDVSREETCIGWEGRGSVAAFLIGTTLIELDYLLLGEVSHVVHADLLSGSRWL